MEYDDLDYDYHTGSFVSKHPTQYNFNGNIVPHLDPRDEPELWVDYKMNLPNHLKPRLKAFYNWKQPERQSVLRHFNKYVYDYYQEY